MMRRWVKDKLGWLVEAPVLIPLGLVLVIGAVYSIEKMTGCHPTYYPRKRATRQAKKDYPFCSCIQVVKASPIDYENDKDRRSNVVLDVCGEKVMYNCFLAIPYSSDTPATYECREADVPIKDILKKHGLSR